MAVHGLLVLLCVAATIRAALAEPLVVTVSDSNRALHIDARLGSEHRVYEVQGALQRLRKLYGRLEKCEYDASAMRSELTSLGASVYGPLKSWLASCDEVQYVVPTELLDCPLDLLMHDGRFLFLKRPVSFAFAPMPLEHFTFSPRWRAVIVSDPSADPQNGCAFLKHMLPASSYCKADDLDLNEVREHPDILLISAHGDIHFDDSDSIGLCDDDVKPRTLARIAPRLVYLDSCQLGVSRRFVQAFLRAGTEYYLAPITSNEAGDSSTKTIRWFFERLRVGDTPTQALFAARLRLFKTYEKTQPLPRLLWKSYPFRVYRLRVPNPGLRLDVRLKRN